MSYYILEMKVICVEGLEEFNLSSSSNMNVYVMVILKGASLKEQNAQTNMVEGGQNPCWNHPMKFFIDRSKQIQALKSHLEFIFVSKNNDEHKDVGKINVPIVELVQVSNHDESLQNICRPINKISGHPTNGNFKFAFKFVQSQAQPQLSQLSSSSSSSLLSSSTSQSLAEVKDQQPAKKNRRLKSIIAKVTVGLGVSVAGGYLSRVLFDHGQKASTSLPSNYLPSLEASNTVPVPSMNSFYNDDGTSSFPTPHDNNATFVIDPTTTTFYCETSPFSTFPDTGAGVVPTDFDSTMLFYSEAPPLDAFPQNAISTFDDQMVWSHGLSTATNGDDDSILGAMVDGVTSFFG